MPYTPQPDSPGANEVLTDAFVQTMLDNIAALKALIDDLESRSWKQIQRSNILAAEVSATPSYANVFTDLTFTTNGGDILMKLVKASSAASGSSAGAVYANVASASSDPVGMVRFLMDSASVGDSGVGASGANQALWVPPSAFECYITGVSAGSHTFNLQAKEETSGDVRIGAGIALLVIELGD